MKPRLFALAATQAEISLDERFQQFVEAHREKAISLAWRLTGGQAQAAEDVAQEAFLRAYKALPRFRDESRLETWFTRILIRQAHNHRRKHTHHQETVTASLLTTHPAMPDPGLQFRVAQALDTLSRGQRETFVLVYLEGFTIAETSKILRRSSGTIKTHLHRALRRLRSELEDLFPLDERTTP
ncbi:MAG: RNA polymerase sigma factor [Myxococcota bacterium]|nr:RNA polymerase sigma factor [Myxococcota bacterium]